MHWSGTR